jgi:opacity protein-like surface antigen
MKLPKNILSIVVLILFSSIRLQANKIDWSTGYFNLVAKTATATGVISSFSYYQLAIRTPIRANLEISIGYTLTLSKTFSLNGDLGYGPDMALVFFPFGSAASLNIENKLGLNFTQHEIYRPFVSGGFHQRQFQSIQASYAGFSLGGGLEYWWKPNFGFRGLGQMILLRGPQKATAQEVDVLAGITFEY